MSSRERPRKIVLSLRARQDTIDILRYTGERSKSPLADHSFTLADYSFFDSSLGPSVGATLAPGAQNKFEPILFLEQGQYGTLTECVDHFLYPEKILAFAWRPS